MPKIVFYASGEMCEMHVGWFSLECMMQVMRSSRVEETWCFDTTTSGASPAAAVKTLACWWCEPRRMARVVLLYAASGIPPSSMFKESFYLGQECGTVWQNILKTFYLFYVTVDSFLWVLVNFYKCVLSWLFKDCMCLLLTCYACSGNCA